MVGTMRVCVAPVMEEESGRKNAYACARARGAPEMEKDPEISRVLGY